jgi:hypothetical protein
MSKFLLNLLVQISKALVNSKIQFLIQKFFFFAFGPADLVAHSAVGPAGPAGLSPLTGQIQPCRPAQLAHVSMAYLRKYAFPFSSRLPSWPSPSRLSVKWARAVNFIFLPRRPTVATSSRCLRPPRAARPPTSRCQARSSLHALIPPLISLLNPSSSHPVINGIKAITAGRFPLPQPGVPLPGHYKRTRSTPPAITTLTSPSITCFRVRIAHSTERLLRRLFPTVAQSCLTLRRPLLQPVQRFRPFSGEPPLRR